MSEFDLNALRQTLAPVSTKTSQREGSSEFIGDTSTQTQDIQHIRHTLELLRNQNQAIQDSLDLILKHLGYDSFE